MNTSRPFNEKFQNGPFLRKMPYYRPWFLTKCSFITKIISTVDAKLKFPFRIRSTLCRVITEDTLEPCHLRLVLSTSLIALALAAVSITKKKTILLDLLITLGEGDKALKYLP